MLDKKDHKQSYQHFLEESFEDLYENAPCGYFSSLPDGTIVKINHTLVRWLGYEKHDILHRKKFQDLLPVGGKIFYETHHSPLMRMQGMVNEINYDLVSKSGALLPVLLNSFHITNAAGTVMLYRSTVVNIADRKKYEVELIQAKKKAEQAAKVKAEFLSTVSHEIRTPMNAIIGVANLLQTTDPTERQQVYLNILKHSSENLLNLINDILDFSKIESGKVTLEEKVFPIRQLIQNLMSNFQPKAEEKSLQLLTYIDEKVPPHLIGDPVKITQVLTNLVSNAIKFTDTGSVTLELRSREITSHQVMIDFRVTDTGIGIAPDKLDKIFEEFTQADYEINLKYGGTGLGLAISKKLLAMYGSALHVASEPGKGSSFSFPLKLKISKETEASPLHAPKGSQGTSLRGIRLLLAEDNAVNVFIVSQYFKEWKIEFDVAENGSVAIEKALQHHYDLILMDLQMPGVNGYEATRILRNLPDEKYKKIPVIALSASSKFDLKERMEYAGITDYISKPFDPNDLYAKIASYGAASIRSVNASQESHVSTAAPAQPVETSLINVAHFRAITKNDPVQLAELIQLSVDNFISFKKDFSKALASRNKELLEDVVHKSKVTITSLSATRLLSLIEGVKKFLDNEGHEAEIKTISRDIAAEIDSIIAALHQHSRAILSGKPIKDVS